MVAQSGIYEVVNTVNGKRYIGSAKDLSARERQHFGGLARQKHHNAHLQNAWVKYGPDAFSFRTLLVCAPADLIDYEQRAIDGYRPEYNLSPTAGSPLGMKHSKKSRANMSAAHKGRGQTPEIMAKMRHAVLGKPMPQEQRDKISAAHRARHPAKVKAPPKDRKGIPHSAAHCAAISAALKGRCGKPHTPEQTAKIAAKNRGQKRTDEQRANISRGAAAVKRPPLSKAQCEQIRMRNLGSKHPHTTEFKARMSKAKKGIPWSAARRAAYDHKAKEMICG